MAQNTVVIAPNTGFTGKRLRNFYITATFQGFVWMVFHFSVVYFFTLFLDNIALVGIFLGIANFVSFLLDIPLGTLQRYVSSKKLFILGGISQFIAIGIFFFFILRFFSAIEVVSTGLAQGISSSRALAETTQWFFGDLMHWIALLIAAVCYGFTKEVNSITNFGYILSNSHPSRTGQIIARANISTGVGSVVGMLLSGVILSASSSFALIFLGAVVIGLPAFIVRYFDNPLDSIDISDIKDFTVSVQKWDANKTRKEIVQTIKKADLGKIVESTKYIFIKPKQKKEKKEKIPWKSILESTKTEMTIIWNIFSEKPLQFGLIWTISLVLIFGFWDTFASSFLLDFLEKVQPGGSYLLLAIIGVPGVLLQDIVSRFTEKIWVKTLGIFGLVLSAGSILFMGILALDPSPSAVGIIVAALINAVGYACGMAIGQNEFLRLYNEIYAEKQNLKEIDANASSGPMNLLQNFANVIGLAGGGMLLAFGFSFFFFVFAVIIGATLVWTLMMRKKIVV